MQKNIIEKNDFIELQYTGFVANDNIKNENIIFDTTDEKTAKNNNLYRKEMLYGGIIICVGESHVVKGLDEALLGKEITKEYTVNVPAEKAFGRKSPKLIQLIAANKFLKDKIQPMPGLQVNIDGNIGVIKTVNSGRILVDFNHPLSSRDVIYTFTIKKKIIDTAEKIKGMLRLIFHISDVEVNVQDKIAVIKVSKELPPELAAQLSEQMKKIIKNVDIIRFEKH